MKKFLFAFFVFCFSICLVKAYDFENVEVGQFVSQNSYLTTNIDEQHSFVIFYIDNDDNLTKTVSYEMDEYAVDYCVGFGARGGSGCIRTFDYELSSEYDDTIEGYIVVSKNKANEACNNYSEIKDKDICKRIISGSDGKKYGSLVVREWRVSDGIYKLVCDEQVEVNNTINCKFYSSFHSSIARVTFSLKGENYELVSMNFNDDITKEYDLSREFYLGSNDGLNSMNYFDEPLLDFYVKPVNDYKGDLDINLAFDIVYYGYASEGPSGSVIDDVSSVVNVVTPDDSDESLSVSDTKNPDDSNEKLSESETKNPETFDRIIVAFILFLLAGMFYFITVSKSINKKIYD